jgi:acetylornithine deacetylase
MGPGSIAQAHTKDEWIALEDLEKGAAFFEAFIRSLKVS